MGRDRGPQEPFIQVGTPAAGRIHICNANQAKSRKSGNKSSMGRFLWGWVDGEVSDTTGSWIRSGFGEFMIFACLGVTFVNKSADHFGVGFDP